MMFTAAALTSTLLALNVLALPTNKQRFVSRLARRGNGGVRGSTPRARLDSAAGAVHSDDVGSGTGPIIEYSNNWAGVVYDKYPAGTFKSVTAKFVVPEPVTPPGGSPEQTYAASVWVGIDGDTCHSAILQTGLDLFVQGSQVAFDAWYEYYPDFAYNFSNITFSIGDVVEMTVTAATTTSGTAYITNLSTGQSVSKFLTSTTPMCLQNAEWIVEDFQLGSSLVPLANWTTVTMTDAVAILLDGSTIGPVGGTVLDLSQNVTDPSGALIPTVFSAVTAGPTTIQVDYVDAPVA